MYLFKKVTNKNNYVEELLKKRLLKIEVFKLIISLAHKHQCFKKYRSTTKLKINSKILY